MSNKRKSEGKDKARRRYRYDGTPIQQNINGPSIWVTCIRGKERQAVGELYDLFEQYAAEMWPHGSGIGESAMTEDNSDEDNSEDEDIEKEIEKEMSTMKRTRKETRFASCQTNTPCFVVMSCKAPIDPMKLVIKHVETVLQTGVTKTRCTQRLTPISGTCATNIQEIKALCIRLFQSHLEQTEQSDSAVTYKIELRMRNHSTLSKATIIEELAKCVPSEHKVNLENPEVFILIEIFKSVCGIGIVRDYYKLQKFNVMEIAKTEEPGFKEKGGRLEQKQISSEQVDVVGKPPL